MFNKCLDKIKDKFTIQAPSLWRQSRLVPMGIFTNLKKIKGVERTIMHGGFYDGTIHIQKTFLQPVKKHNSRVTAIQIDENEDFVISGEEKGGIVIWSVDEKQSKFATHKIIQNHED